MSTLFGFVHTGDSIANPANGYFFQAFGFTPRGDNTQPQTEAQTTYYVGADLIMRPLGIAGSRLDHGDPIDLVELCPVWVDPIIPVGYSIPPFARERKYIFCTAIGSNDGAIDGYATPNDYADAVAACCGLRRTAGFVLLVMCTLLPRTDGVMTEPHRIAYNTRIKDPSWQKSHGIDLVIDLAGQPIMGNPASCADPTYYDSGVHPTTAGHALLAPIFASGVAAAVALLSVGTPMTTFTPLTFQGEIPTSDSLNRALNQLQTQITSLVSSGGFANPMTTGGDMIYGGALGVATRLANGTAGQVLTSNGTTLAPSWQATGGSSGITIGTTTITSGTTTRLLYDAAGVVGESAGVTTDGTSLTITPAANASALTIASQTHTSATNTISIAQTWNNSGATFTGIFQNITNTASAVQSRLIDLQVGSASQFSITPSGNLTVTGSMQAANSINLTQNTAFIQIGARFFFDTNADGNLRLNNNAGTGFNMLLFGGATTSFPALKRSTTNIQCRLADDSAYATFDALAYKVGGAAGVSFGPAAVTSITVVNGIITAIS